MTDKEKLQEAIDTSIKEFNRAETLKTLLKRKEQECKNLKQTLLEIKDIAEEQQSWNECNRQYSETESEDDIFAYNWNALKQILQKISESEIDNAR